MKNISVYHWIFCLSKMLESQTSTFKVIQEYIERAGPSLNQETSSYAPTHPTDWQLRFHLPKNGLRPGIDRLVSGFLQDAVRRRSLTLALGKMMKVKQGSCWSVALVNGTDAWKDERCKNVMRLKMAAVLYNTIWYSGWCGRECLPVMFEEFTVRKDWQDF